MMDFNTFYYGTAYHPERYPHDDDKLSQDAALMGRLHMNAALISSDTIRYVTGVGGGYEWLDRILTALAEEGIGAAIELPDTLPPHELLLRFERDERVPFFQVSSPQAAEAMQIVHGLRVDGIRKPVSVFLSGKELFAGLKDLKDADILSFCCAPEWTCGEVMEEAGKAAFLEDRIRSLKQMPFIFSGVDPMRILSRGCSKLRPAQTLKTEILQAAVHGARGCFFRDFRQERCGENRYAGAVIPHSGRTDLGVFCEIEQIGRLLEEMQTLVRTSVEARCAVICTDEEREAAQRIYNAIRSLGVSVDVLGEGDDFDRYLFVAAFGMRRVSDETAEKVRSFVEGGGVWLAGWGFAAEDDEGGCYSGEIPHALTDVFGVRAEDTEELYPEETIPLKTAPDLKRRKKQQHSVRKILEIVRAEEADVVAVYDDGSYKGSPALVRKAYGKGFAYYLAADCDDALLHILCDKILKGKKGVARVKMTEGIAVQRLSDEEAEYLIFQNFNNREKRLPLDYNKLDIIFGYDPVPASSALVLRVPRKGRKPSQDPSAEE